MAKLLVSLLSGALLFFVVPCAFGDLVPPYLSNVKVTLINGESVTGASYGLVSIFVSGTPPRQVKTVELSHTAGSVMGHFTFFDKSKSETYEKSTAQVSRLKLSPT
jgi:hypothetical protein